MYIFNMILKIPLFFIKMQYQLSKIGTLEESNNSSSIQVRKLCRTIYFVKYGWMTKNKWQSKFRFLQMHFDQSFYSYLLSKFIIALSNRKLLDLSTCMFSDFSFLQSIVFCKKLIESQMITLTMNFVTCQHSIL